MRAGQDSETRRYIPWLVLAAVVIAIDQGSKHWVASHFELAESRQITEYFNLVLVHNKGAAFSLLSEEEGWQRWFFTILALLASGLMAWMIRTHLPQRLFCFSLSMILGGALGNAIDRIRSGWVVDFLQFHFGILKPLFPGGYFPSFNAADSAITLGAACLVLDELVRMRRAR
jgi:signal peptidase II